MRHTLNRIVGKPDDYIKCKSCISLNWYENGNCVACGHTLFLYLLNRDEVVMFLQNYAEAFDNPDDWDSITKEV